MKRRGLCILMAMVMIGSITACTRKTGASLGNAQTVKESGGEVAPSQTDGKVLGITATAHVNKVYHQIGAIYVEYDRPVVAPGMDGYTVEDFAVSNYKEDYDKRTSSKAPVVAVYTNNQPELRDDKSSVEGNYVVIELEPTSYCVEEDGIYKPNHNAGMCTWRLDGEACEWLRDDFSQLVITQNVDLKGLDGNVVVAAAELPRLTKENVVTPELVQFENKVIENFDGRDNSIYYTLYLPENYDPEKEYPLLFNSPGNGGRLNYEQTNAAGEYVNIGAVVSRDRVAVTVAEQQEAIIASIQTWRNQPEEWGYDDVAAGLYLMDYMKDNYSVDEDRVYAIGSSYGTMLVSRMLNENPELFTGYIQYNGCWSVENIAEEGGWLSTYKSNDPKARNGMQIFDGYDFSSALDVMKENSMEDISRAKELMAPVAKAEIPVWVWHAVNDETISFMHGVSTYETLVALYEDEGMNPSRISQLVKLRVVEDEEYWNAGIAERHACSKLAATYPEAISWLFRQKKGGGAVSLK